MNTWIQVGISLTIIGVVLYIISWLSSLVSEKEASRPREESAPATKAEGTLSGFRKWFSDHHDLIQTLVLTVLGVGTVHMLCMKLGKQGWWQLYNHEAFWALNAAFILAIFLTLVAKKTVVKLCAAVILFMVAFESWQIWRGGHNPSSQTVYTLKANQWSSPIVLLGNKVKTFPDHVPVEFEDVETGQITHIGSEQKVHLAGVNVVRIRSQERIRYTVEPQ